MNFYLLEKIEEHYPTVGYQDGRVSYVNCVCGGKFITTTGWSKHLTEILEKRLEPFLDQQPKAVLSSEDLDAWGNWIKDTCIKFGVDTRTAWKVAGEFVFGVQRERGKT